MILKDQVAIVTGAGSGIGRAGAMIMAREGAHVAVLDRDPAGAEDTVSLIHALGGAVHVHEVREQPQLGRREILQQRAARQQPLDLAREARRVPEILEVRELRDVVGHGGSAQAADDSSR